MCWAVKQVTVCWSKKCDYEVTEEWWTEKLCARALARKKEIGSTFQEEYRGELDYKLYSECEDRPKNQEILQTTAMLCDKCELIDGPEAHEDNAEVWEQLRIWCGKDVLLGRLRSCADTLGQPLVPGLVRRASVC